MDSLLLCNKSEASLPSKDTHTETQAYLPLSLSDTEFSYHMFYKAPPSKWAEVARGRPSALPRSFMRSRRQLATSLPTFYKGSSVHVGKRLNSSDKNLKTSQIGHTLSRLFFQISFTKCSLLPIHVFSHFGVLLYMKYLSMLAPVCPPRPGLPSP